MKKVVHLMICGGVRKMSLKYLLDLKAIFGSLNCLWDVEI